MILTKNEILFLLTVTFCLYTYLLINKYVYINVYIYGEIDSGEFKNRSVRVCWLKRINGSRMLGSVVILEDNRGAGVFSTDTFIES